jgi:O-methyltransferase involved in polyketide biosynthesis
LIEQRLPIYSRWSLYALGAVEGRRILRPKDPVAAWLLRHHPGLLPSVPAPAVLTTIRARTAMVDDVIAEEVARARSNGHPMSIVTLGSAFDARWVRMYREVTGVVRSFVEIEQPEMLAYKESLMSGSPFHGRWALVKRSPMSFDDWEVPAELGVQSVVVLEGLADRFGARALRELLIRLRHHASASRLVVDLSSVEDRSVWSAKALAGLGWRVELDADISRRDRLQTVTGQEICAGMKAFRVVRLSAMEPRQ